MIEQNFSLIDESIQLELNVAELYRIFQAAFPQDADLWRELYREEKNHAALIRSARDSFATRGNFPYDLISDSIEDLVKDNAKLTTLITRYRKKAPSRKEAFRKAVEVEKLAGESHYKKFMGRKPKTRLDSVFQQLNMDDNAHADRITAYMEEQGL
ncbi:MAG: hypothetical protein K9M45_01440 [Kiritimatiellales bacterium]|nr:hypothetical protein [Kiritimatiellales bacterium]